MTCSIDYFELHRVKSGMNGEQDHDQIQSFTYELNVLVNEKMVGGIPEWICIKRKSLQ